MSAIFPPSLWRKIVRDLTRRRARSLLTVLGIAIGVGSLVAIISTSRSLAEAQAFAYANTSQADLAYWVWDAPLGLQRLLSLLPNIDAVEMRSTYYTRARLGEAWHDIYFVGIEKFDDMRVSKIELREGRYPDANEVLLEISARDLAPLEVGQKIAFRSGVDHVERELTISGFVQTPAYLSSSFINLVLAYAPAVRVRQMLDASGSNQILVKLRDFAARGDTMREIRQLLEKRGIQYQEPTVRDPGYFEGKRELDALIRLMYAFSALGLLISAFLVTNTLSAAVAEQAREIGIMKAVGGDRAQILRLYLLAAAIYGFLGTLVGLALGILVSRLLLRYAAWALNLPIVSYFPGAAIALGLVVGLGISLVGGIGPARQAANLSVQKTLRSYGISSAYAETRLSRLSRRLAGLPPLVAVGWRNLLRRQGRLILTWLFVGAATAALLAALSTSWSVNRTIAQIFATYDADAWIWLNEIISNHFEAELRMVPEVRAAEAWTIGDAWVRFARVRLWGVPPDTILYRPQVVAGRWLQPTEPEAVVISMDLAARGIQVGDLIEVDTGEAIRPFRVVGIVLDNAIFLGGAVAGKVFVPRETAERMLGRLRKGYFFALGLTEKEPTAVDEILNRIERKFRALRPVTQAAYRDMRSAAQQSFLLKIALYVMTILISFAGAIGVLNTQSLNVIERRREIGVMRAIGASDRNLLQVFLAEGLILGLLSAFLGLLLAYPVASVLLHFLSDVLFEIDLLFPPVLLLVGVGFAVGLSTLASLLPAWGAARFPAQEALRYE